MNRTFSGYVLKCMMIIIVIILRKLCVLWFCAYEQRVYQRRVNKKLWSLSWQWGRWVPFPYLYIPCWVATNMVHSIEFAVGYPKTPIAKYHQSSAQQQTMLIICEKPLTDTWSCALYCCICSVSGACDHNNYYQYFVCECEIGVGVGCVYCVQWQWCYLTKKRFHK